MTDLFVYIPECADGSYHTGQTDDFNKRLGEHKHGSCDGYTSLRRSVKLLWNTRFQSRDDAFQFERRVENWSRIKKKALLVGDWAGLQRAAMPPGERESR